MYFMNKDKQKFLEGHKDDLQKGIWGFELDVRHLERQKITAKEGELIEIENTIRSRMAQINAYKSRMELIDDVISESKENLK